MKFRLFAAVALTIVTSTPQIPGKAAYDVFTAWRKSTAGLIEDWDKAVAQYRIKLRNEGLSEGALSRVVQSIEAYGEAELYDEVYATAPTFNTEPNKLLADAVKGRKPGRALDVAMGQGRNSVFLAREGWDVTGFDVSEAGIRKAQQLAGLRSVKMTTVLASDEDFQFGEAQWDLITLIYVIEKRSVHRVRRALKPGGLVVIEAGHKSASGAPFEYESKELLRIFEGFRILRYEEPVSVPDWGKEPIRLVRLVAEKPR